MKIKKGFAKREIAGTNIVVPVGEGTRVFNGMITLNDTGSFIWDALQNDTTPEKIADALCSEYDVDPAKAKEDTDKFISMLRQNNLIDE